MDCSPPGSSVHGILQAGYWSGLPRPPPGDLLDPGIKPTSLMSPALAGGFVPPGKPSFYTSGAQLGISGELYLLPWGSETLVMSHLKARRNFSLILVVFRSKFESIFSRPLTDSVTLTIMLFIFSTPWFLHLDFRTSKIIYSWVYCND